MGNFFGNFYGAFADTAVLLPLLATLSIHNGMSFALLLASAGLLYILSGLFYKVPMSVQPLKSIAIAGITLGATQMEIRISGALLGVILFSLIFLNLNKIEEKIPKVIIHGIQLSLGLLLITQGFKQIPALTNLTLTFGILSLFILLFLDRVSKIPTLGIFSIVAILVALNSHTQEIHQRNSVLSNTNHLAELRWALILSLVLPQFLLTINNSVLATKDVSQRYFGPQANRVTTKNLLQFIGLGNILLSFFGGLPFCHGSGGITAHVKGGAKTKMSNFIIGGFLLALGFFADFKSINTLSLMPIFLFIILTSIGLFHLKLAKSSWETSSKKTLIAMGVASLLSQNILFSFVIGMIVFYTEKTRCLSIKKPF